MKTQFLSAARGLFLLLAVWMNVLPGVHAQAPGEAACYYLGDWPGKTTPGWNVEAQGLAHDQENWYIAQDLKIWRIPVWHDLNSNAEGLGFTNVLLAKTPLFAEDYYHFGDPECFEHGGQTFLLVPVEGARDLEHGHRGAPHPAIALFRADSLTFVGRDYLYEQGGAPWCAVDTNGNVYSSNFDVNNDYPIRKYAVNWANVIASGEFHLSAPEKIWLTNESETVLNLPRVQGGVITPSGTLLYLVAGYVKVLGGSDPALLDTDGIHAFDLNSGREVRRSDRHSGIFRFDWNPDFPVQEEPEGLTFWDLDDGRAPNISGQLHVLLLDNDAPDDDDILVKHYTSTLHVDRSYNGTEIGSLREPFNTVNEANDRIWDGAQITIASGLYAEALTFSKRIAVVPSGGPVTIGRIGR